MLGVQCRSFTPWCPGWGGTLIFSYICGLGSFFWVEFQYFLGVFRKMNNLGYGDVVDISLGSSQNWTLFRGHFYVF